jgi:AraC-like DNA-binding protein
MRYFNEIRLCHAEIALLAGESVEEASRKAGFASSSYFCRYFKNYTGRTPGEFRNDR